MTTIIDCNGRAHLATLPALQSDLIESLERADSVSLCLADIENVELGFLQLIEAARLSAARLGKSLQLATPAPQPLRQALDASGLLAKRTPDDLAFWLHEGDVR